MTLALVHNIWVFGAAFTYYHFLAEFLQSEGDLPRLGYAIWIVFWPLWWLIKLVKWQAGALIYLERCRKQRRREREMAKRPPDEPPQMGIYR